LSVKGLEELSEVPLCVVRARGGLGVVLDGENGALPMPHSFDRTVIEVKVRDLKRLRTRDACGVSLDGESVVL
jgi:hypothetical protein